MGIQTKQCTKCGEIKELTEFYKEKKGKNGLESKCKKCKHNYYENYYKNNKSNIQKHYQVNKIRIRQQQKDYYEINKEIIRKYRKENYQVNRNDILNYQKRSGKKYRENNPNKKCADSAKRRAVKRQAFASWADLEIIEKLYKDADFYSRVSGDSYHVDHIDPLQSPLICGLHVENNLRIVEASVNIAKHNTFTPYRIDENGKKHPIKVPQWWITKCQRYYEAMRELNS